MASTAKRCLLLKQLMSWVIFWEALYMPYMTLAGVQIAAAYLPVEETPPFISEGSETVRKLKGGKVADVCNVSAEMLKAKDEVMIHASHGLHMVLSAVWQPDT